MTREGCDGVAVLSDLIFQVLRAPEKKWRSSQNSAIHWVFDSSAVMGARVRCNELIP